MELLIFAIETIAFLVVAMIMNNATRGKYGYSFIWGYWHCLAAIIVPGTLVTLVAFFYAYTDFARYITIDATKGIIIVTLQFLGGVLTLLRFKIGAILLTVMTFNPISWFINYKYFKNRWSGFRNFGEKIPLAEYETPFAKAATAKFDMAAIQGSWSNDRFKLVVDGATIEIVDSLNIVRLSATKEIRDYSRYVMLAYSNADGSKTNVTIRPVDASSLKFEIASNAANYEGTLTRGN